MTLGDFGKFMPELLKLGLPASTKLTGTKAWSYRVRPGASSFPARSRAVSRWRAGRRRKGRPLPLRLLLRIRRLDFYAIAETHAVGERFLVKVLQGEMAGSRCPTARSSAARRSASS